MDRQREKRNMVKTVWVGNGKYFENEVLWVPTLKQSEICASLCIIKTHKVKKGCIKLQKDGVNGKNCSCKQVESNNRMIEKMKMKWKSRRNILRYIRLQEW